ncbi:N-acetylglucosaminyl-diphospho-decaprenol L-rhamnosyltransferase [Haloechinothrix alba]|uniref:N-acetylglucosaminyl-diphospho-decaprenol L-rhamnosyltransferase n=1 Tax=Haloechinothrix alba TaxID=664784 RepID=A0A238VX28_9PSEU|nr:N-acetylglucosaminyl-diphospho-decaprenol L-rhamnosyltransferase [Haloechinothrix alba]
MTAVTKTTGSGTYGDGVAVVTVTYSPGRTLERFIETLAKSTTRQLRVVLADNGSTDGTPELAAERDGVVLVRMGENLGYGAAANKVVFGLDDSVGWVVVANPDLEWGSDALDRLLEATERWPAAATFGPLITDPHGAVYPSARSLPTLGSGIGHALFARLWPANPWTRAYRQEDVEPAERTTGWLSGSCLLLRREAFEAVQGFDPRYFMYFEDVDLGDRLGRAGWLNVYVPSAQVMHVGGHATTRVSRRMLATHHASAYRYLTDRYPGSCWKPILAAVRLGLAVRLRMASRAPDPHTTTAVARDLR